jgi:ElaB/YqjD/DUF883 family membrane-anchored ribosome-binding protein
MAKRTGAGNTRTNRGGGRRLGSGLAQRGGPAGQPSGGQAEKMRGSGNRLEAGLATRTQETMAQAVGKVREHPWPSLLIGAGVTWLAVDAIRGRSSESEGVRGSRRKVEEEPGLVSRTASTIAEAGRGAGEYVGDFVRERPLIAGAATLGIGMAVGMAIPSTSAEDSMMGHVRDNVVRRAKDVAKGTVEAVRDVADGVDRMAGGRERERTR